MTRKSSYITNLSERSQGVNILMAHVSEVSQTNVPLFIAKKLEDND